MNGNTLEIDRLSDLSGGQSPFSFAFLKQFFDSLFDGIYVVDKERKIIYWNKGAESLTGFSQDETVGRYCHSGVLNHTDGAGCKMCENNCPFTKVFETEQLQYNRVFFRHKDRRRVAVAMYSVPLKNEHNEMIGVMGIFRDACEAVALDDAYNLLRELLVKDPLTGAVCRSQLDKIIPDQLGLLQHSGIPFSLILLRIDRFRQLIRDLGLAEVNKILVHFAQVLQRQCRGSDIIGRFNEGNFLVLIRGHKIKTALQMAERLKIAVSTSRRFCKNLTASLGVTEAVIDDTAESLAKRVLQALHKARINGGNRVEVLEPSAAML